MAGWTKSAFLTESLPGEFAALKARRGGDILVDDSASLVHALTPFGLIDEFRLMVYPIILGQGKRLFPEAVKAALSLLECKQLGSGIVRIRYQPGE